MGCVLLLGESGVPRASSLPTGTARRGSRGGGGELLPSRTGSVFLLSSSLFSLVPPVPPRPSSRGRWQWMLRSQTKHAGLLFGGGGLSAPLAPCQKHVQPPALCLREVLFSLPPPSLPPPPAKPLFVSFPHRAPPSRCRGARVRAVFPTWGEESGAAHNSERGDPRAPGNSLFAVGAGTPAGGSAGGSQTSSAPLAALFW